MIVFFRISFATHTNYHCINSPLEGGNIYLAAEVHRLEELGNSNSVMNDIFFCTIHIICRVDIL